jgi:hypothetical protein
MKEQILGMCVALAMSVPTFALAQEAGAAQAGDEAPAAEEKAGAAAAAPAAPAAEEKKAAEEAKEVATPAPPAAPVTVAEPPKTAAADQKFEKWLEGFKAKHAKAAERLLKLREAVKAAKEKYDAAKTDKGLRRALILARRDLTRFWYGFRTNQLRGLKVRIGRIAKEHRRLRIQLRNLLRQAAR